MHRKHSFYMVFVVLFFIAGSSYLTAAMAKVNIIDGVKLNSKFYQTVILQMPPTFRIFVKSKSEVYLAASKTFATSLSTTPAAIVGKTDYDITTRADAIKYRKDDRQVMDSGKPKLNYVENALDPSGKQVKVITSKVPLRNTAGNIIGIIGMSFKYHPR